LRQTLNVLPSYDLPQLDSHPSARIRRAVFDSFAADIPDRAADTLARFDPSSL
jgi:hypothetical protein